VSEFELAGRKRGAPDFRVDRVFNRNVQSLRLQNALLQTRDPLRSRGYGEDVLDERSLRDYFSVVKEGKWRGDAIEQVADGPEQVSVADIVWLYKRETTDPELSHALKTLLSGSWKREIRSRWVEA